MIINSNISALNTVGNLNKNEMQRNSSLEKLSSGIRINRAADDVAGLSISENMRAQIRGLSQAQRNVQDGISLAQVADSGLGEILDPNLLNMRRLAVQAATGTLTDEDRQILQRDFDQTKQGIDDIAINTKFNTIGLLAPNGALPIGQNQVVPAISNAIDIVFLLDTTGSMTGNLQTIKNGIDSFIDNMAKLGDTQVAFVGINSNLPDFTPFQSNKSSIKSELSDYINHIGHPDDAPGTKPYDNIINSIPSGSIGSSLGYRTDSKKVFILLTDAINEVNTSTNSQIDAMNAAEGSNLIAGVDSDDIQTFVMGFSGNSFNPNAYSNIATSTGGNIYTPSTATDITNALLTDLPVAIAGISNISNIGTSTVYDDNSGWFATLKLQVGANSGQHFNIELFDARITNLGIANSVIDPWTKAEEAIGQIDKAIQKISVQRTRFGVYQNALEHIASNVINSDENLTASESRIRDIDMAKEMTRFKESEIISQAAQAMLVQANQQHQAVLKLLK